LHLPVYGLVTPRPVTGGWRSNLVLVHALVY